MRINAMDEKYEAVTVLDHLMLFTCLRVDRSTVPEGLYMYEVRHDDEGQGDPVQIANWILVNHWGTLITDSPIELGPCEKNGNSYLDIEPEEDWNYTPGFSMTVEEYMKASRANRNDSQKGSDAYDD